MAQCTREERATQGKGKLFEIFTPHNQTDQVLVLHARCDVWLISPLLKSVQGKARGDRGTSYRRMREWDGDGSGWRMNICTQEDG